MDRIEVEIFVQTVDGKPTVILQVGKSAAYLTSNEGMAIAEAIAEATGIVDNMNEAAGIVEPEAIGMVSFGNGENPPQSLAEFLEELGEATQEVEPPKRTLH